MRIAVDIEELAAAGGEADRVSSALAMAAAHLRVCVDAVHGWAGDLRLEDEAQELLSALRWAVDDARRAADGLREDVLRAASVYSAADRLGGR